MRNEECPFLYEDDKECRKGTKCFVAYESCGLWYKKNLANLERPEGEEIGIGAMVSYHVVNGRLAS